MGGWGCNPKSGSAGGEVIPIGIPQVPGDTSIPDPSGYFYSEALSVTFGVTTDVLVWVVPATPIIHLLRISFGGENIAKYFLDLDGTRIDQYIVWYNGSGLHGEFNYIKTPSAGRKLNPGSVLKVQVLHIQPDVSDHYASLQYMEIN